MIRKIDNKEVLVMTVQKVFSEAMARAIHQALAHTKDWVGKKDHLEVPNLCFSSLESVFDDIEDHFYNSKSSKKKSKKKG